MQKNSFSVNVCSVVFQILNMKRKLKKYIKITIYIENGQNAERIQEYYRRKCH
jgi:hypothetical protein